MSEDDVNMFNGLIGGNIRIDNINHQLHLKWYKTVYGFVAICSCGKSIGRNSITGNNLAGFNCQIVAIKERFNKHVQQEGK